MKRMQQIVERLKLSLFYSSENKIFTHLTQQEKLQLVKLAAGVDGNVFLEIGSYLGASSCFIAEGIRNSSNSGSLYCVDTWENDAMSEGKRNTYDDFLHNTSKCRQLITVLRGHSIEVAESFPNKIDFIFFDGDHSYEGIKADFNAWFPKLSDGALMVFHDVGWAEGVQKVIEQDARRNVENEGRLPNMWWGWVAKGQCSEDSQSQ